MIPLPLSKRRQSTEKLNNAFKVTQLVHAWHEIGIQVVLIQSQVLLCLCRVGGNSQMCVSAHACMCVHVKVTSQTRDAVIRMPSFILRQAIPLAWCSLTRVSGYEGTCLCFLSALGLQMFLCGFWGITSSFHTCKARNSLTESSPQYSEPCF